MNGPSPPHSGGAVLGGPPLIVLCLLGVIALLAAGAILIVWANRRPARARAARFATRAELAQLRVGAPQAGRVTLGVHHGDTIACEARASVMVVGPSQSGKTTGLVVPALLEWDGPALSTSIKSDVVKDTHVAREAKGEVRFFDPTGSTQLPHTPWSPIAAARTWEGARRTAARRRRAWPGAIRG